MKHIWSITAKELRGYFNSAVALLFLATFLVVVMLMFFFVERFFARDIADVRPLFDWLPLLLIFLVSALTMRLWSEEQKAGTLELLLTLPVPLHRFVLGKFLASLILVAIALALTFGLPLTVSQMGDLDWGPVFGGYLAAMLLAGTYLSVGLCVSAATENQIVALISTAVICFLLYLPGMSVLTSLVSIDSAELLRQFGTGSRFESIARGVLDLRDLAYYISLVAVFLTLNVVLLRAKGWGKSESRRSARINSVLSVGLVAANALAFNLWLKPVHSVRMDITQHGLYSLSAPTENILGQLQEPLTIRGYFSSNIHQDVDPLVPQIKDMLREYQIASRGKVRLEFVDPSLDEALAQEAIEEYGISTSPIMTEDRHESKVTNAFFHILIMYGSQAEALEYEHLVRVERDGAGGSIYFLGNIEYEITRSIKKVVRGFESVDTLFADIKRDVVIESYVSRTGLRGSEEDVAKGMLAIANNMDSVVAEFVAKSGGKLTYRQIPEDDQMKERADAAGLRAYPLRSGDKVTPVYFYWTVRSGEQVERVQVSADEVKATVGALRQAITNSLRRLAPGFIRVVGLVVPRGAAPPPAEGHMPTMEMPAPQNFKALERHLRTLYRVVNVPMHKEPISDDVDVLIVAGPEKLRPIELLQLDQFLMRGGSLILLVGNQRPRPGFRGSPTIERVTTNLDPLLSNYGVTVSEHFIMDEKRDPVIMQLGREMLKVGYPLFTSIDAGAMREGGVITAGIKHLTMHFANPVSVEPKQVEGAPPMTAQVLMRSSTNSWLHKHHNVRPDLTAHPKLGFPKPEVMVDGEAGPHVLGVALQGTFESAFAGKLQLRSGSIDTLLHKSPSDARLVVIGSSSFASDAMLSLAAELDMKDVKATIQLVHNIVDWSLEDTDLLSIRAIRTAGSLDVSDSERTRWEWINYVIALLGLALVVGLSRALPRPTIAFVAVSSARIRDEDEDDGGEEDEDGEENDDGDEDEDDGGGEENEDDGGGEENEDDGGGEENEDGDGEEEEEDDDDTVEAGDGDVDANGSSKADKS